MRLGTHLSKSDTRNEPRGATNHEENRMKKRTVVSIVISIALLAAASFIAFNSLDGFPPGRGIAGPGGPPPPGSGADGPPSPEAESRSQRGASSEDAASEDASSEGAAESAAAERPAGERTAARGGSTQSGPTVVAVTTAERRDLLGDVRLNGEIEAASTVTIYPEVSGTVERLEVVEGSYVQEDQPVAFIDSSRPGAQFQASPVRSPIAGTIITVQIERGAQAGPQVPVATVATLNRLQVEVEVPERYASALRRGMEGSFTAASYGEQAFPAVVSSVEPILDAATRSKGITLRATGSTSGLEPGMFVRVSLPLRRAPDVVTVPFRAIAQEGGGEYVYTVEDGIARRVRVRTGVIADNAVEIRGGIEAGATVITDGLQQVRPNQPVRLAGGEPADRAEGAGGAEADTSAAGGADASGPAAGASGGAATSDGEGAQ
jgi:multidrug efflux pump subunit AcrA (membrane-fusion protein)